MMCIPGWKGEKRDRSELKALPGREPLILVDQRGITGDLSIPSFWVIAEPPAVTQVTPVPVWRQVRGKGDLKTAQQTDTP